MRVARGKTVMMEGGVIRRIMRAPLQPMSQRTKSGFAALAQLDVIALKWGK